MTYKELFEKLSPEQMEQDIIVFNDAEDNDSPIMIEQVKVSTEETYYDSVDGDRIGNLEEVKRYFEESEIENMIVHPIRSVTLHSLKN